MAFRSFGTNTGLVDLGASYHLTIYETSVPNYIVYDGSRSIIVGNCDKLLISSVGSGLLHASYKCVLNITNTLDTLHASIVYCLFKGYARIIMCSLNFIMIFLCKLSHLQEDTSSSY